MEECPRFHYTPINIAQELIKDISFNENDITLEPCKGRTNNFYNLIPYNKEWCEIDEGRDFFNYDFKGKSFSKVITNPPYTTNHKKKEDRKNIFMPFVFECLKYCSDECWLLLNNKMFNGFTPLRLNKIKTMGFEICYIKILNIKEWYGRYYWICFKKDCKGIINF